MKVSVWDTYVKRDDGSVMHFDILVNSEDKSSQRVYEFGRKYLDTKSFGTTRISSAECQFCHVEEATAEVNANIQENGFHIVELANCN